MFRPEYEVQRAVVATESSRLERRLEQIRGLRLDVVSETDVEWDLARRAWNLIVDQHPRHVAFPETADDVVKLVTFAAGEGLRVAPQGTGHGAGALGAIEDAVLIKPSRMREISIDPARRRARVGAGVTWAEVQAAAAEHGLAGLAGTSPELGVVGYTVGGGLGWFARRYGLACNSVVAFDVVTAGGVLLHVDCEHEPDLFWALRGGGGSFGVITAIEFALYPVRDLYAGALYWPQERAAEVLQAWRAWTSDISDSVTSVYRLVNFSRGPEVPEALRGRSNVLVEAACMTTEKEGVDLLRELRKLGPEVDTFRMLATTALGALHMDPVDPVPLSIDGWLLDDLPPAAMEAVVRSAGLESGSPLWSVELRHLGGALLDAAPEHGALASLDAQFAMAAISLVPNPDAAAAVESHLSLVRAALEPWESDRNFPNFAERSFSASDFHSPATRERLGRVKAKYDPHDLISSTHPIR